MKKTSNYIITTFMLLFGLVTSILFWVFLFRGDVYEDLYPLVGHLVASHGALIGTMVYIINTRKL